MKIYLGDGVYVLYDGYQIWLTTEDGTKVTNRIALEPGTYVALTEYVEQLRNKTEDADDNQNAH